MGKELENKNKKLKFAAQAVIILLAAVCLFVMASGSNQSAASIPIPETFEGEYRIDGGQWQPLSHEALPELSAYDGELTARLRFDYEVAQGARLNFYLDHIGYRICINGEFYMESATMDAGFLTDICGSRWEYILSPGITPEDEVEITLANPHRYGNENAYMEFFSNLYIGPDNNQILAGYLEPFGRPLRIAGLIAIITAFMLIGAAAAASAARFSRALSIWEYGAMTFFAGAYTILDTVDISLVSSRIIFNTYGKCLCIMLFTLMLGFAAAGRLTGKKRKIAQIALYISAAAEGTIIVLSCTGVSAIYDMYLPWAVLQEVISLIMLCCSAWQFRQTEGKERLFPSSSVLLYGAIMLDLAGVGANMYSHFTITKIIFGVLLLVHICKTTANIILNYQTAYRAELLEKELEESRISIMLSQIQPHFIYNTLGTIRHLCMSSPKKAAELADDFSMYLRGNFSELDNREPIPLSREMEHVKHYVNIEKVRFPDIEIVFSLDSEDFMLPALSVQPLVENAIKHGLMGMEKGGRVEISSYETEKAYCVCVKDNGVGFDVSAVHDDRKHVGIHNTERRIEAMCGGSLKVESTIGEGTTALISIPKEGVK